MINKKTLFCSVSSLLFFSSNIFASDVLIEHKLTYEGATPYCIPNSVAPLSFEINYVDLNQANMPERSVLDTKSGTITFTDCPVGQALEITANELIDLPGGMSYSAFKGDAKEYFGIHNYIDGGSSGKFIFNSSVNKRTINLDDTKSIPFSSDLIMLKTADEMKSLKGDTYTSVVSYTIMPV